MSKNRFILLFSVFFLLSIKGKSQATLTMKNVSVINEQGHVRLSWEYFGGVEDLVIFRDSLELKIMDDINTLGPEENTYIDATANAHKKPRSYRIKQDENAILNPIYTDIVSTFYLTYSYDTCMQQINLEWTDLETTYFDANEWNPVQFTVNVTEDGILQKIPVDTSQNYYTVENIKENTNYKFRVETHWLETTETSYSNSINFFTEMPESPNYINALSVITDGDNTNLQFEVAPNSELTTYRLLKSDSYDGTFDSLKTFVSNDKIINVTHFNSQPDSKISYYKLASVNQCGNETTNSNVIDNIVLNLENNNFENTLTWNLLRNFDLFSGTYKVYRITGNSAPDSIRSFKNYNRIVDDTELLQGQNLNGQFCYYVKVIKDGETEGYYSQSNTACIHFEPKVYIPQAFTPNDDDINDLFLPIFSFLPKDYLLKIYNRWGNIVFETTDPTKGWNGKEPNGKSAPAGSYIYLLKIKTENNQTIEKRNNITVIYP